MFKDRKGLKIRLYRKAKKVLFRHGVDVKKNINCGRGIMD